MSADNGIYILVTPKNNEFEYRVSHMQAIDNLDYDVSNNDYVNNITSYSELDKNNIRIKNAREMFKHSPIFNNEADAFDAAIILYKKYDYTEYGICRIEIPIEF